VALGGRRSGGNGPKEPTCCAIKTLAVRITETCPSRCFDIAVPRIGNRSGHKSSLALGSAALASFVSCSIFTFRTIKLRVSNIGTIHAKSAAKYSNRGRVFLSCWSMVIKILIIIILFVRILSRN
jgi:hypothetical protein